MKKVIYTICIAALTGMSALPLEAQTIYDGQIPVEVQSLIQEGDSVYVSILFDLTALTMDKDRYLTLTPVLADDNGGEKKLKDIRINGHLQHKLFLREMNLKNAQQQQNSPHYTAVELDDKKKQKEIVSYTLAVAYEDWMADAFLDVKAELCACAGASQSEFSDRIADYITLSEGGETIYDGRVLDNPHVAYIRPKAEAVKARSESYNIYLDFPVAKATVNPNFGNNPRELAKIGNILRNIRADANVFITGISITGYASPDGSVGINNKLARERADAVRKYLASKSGIPAYLYSLGSGGEDWEGALWLMGQTTPFALRNTATSIIRNYGPADRERQLRKLDNGKLWIWMMKEIFPPLRRVVCKIEYNVRGFNVDDAKRIIRTRPQQLNLGEMFVLANVYAEGSKDFEAVFETAVRLYPDDPIANLNAAASALLEKDANKAERYLQRAQKNTPAYYNNMGALMMLQNQPARAREYFQRAAQSNLGAALRNLQDMDK